MKREERYISRQCRKYGRNEILWHAEKAALKAGIPLDVLLEKIFDDTANRIKEERMNQRIMIEDAIRRLGIRLPNGTLKKEYSQTFEIPVQIREKISGLRLEGADSLGLLFEEVEPGQFRLHGKVMDGNGGDMKLKLKYQTIEGEPESELEIPIAFNPNPRDLWRNIPSDPDVCPFHKPDEDKSFIKVKTDDVEDGRKDVAVASQRGRSHAQEGKPRDDDFKICHDKDSDWYVLAVADGAGSAKYSRKGSEIACRTVVEQCLKLLSENYEFEDAITKWAADRTDDEKRMKVTHDVVDIVLRKGAVKAFEAIKKVADANPDYKLKDFATTLMFAICKKYDFGWFIASFWVGDGAMAIYDEKNESVKLLGMPDEGEFSGQTRFLTMPEIFHDREVIAKRLRMAIVPDFTALFLMTDGVSDPMFETDRNLNDYNKWKEFFGKLKTGFPEDEMAGVDFSSRNEETGQQLLNWLDFWSPGNHDDRTVAILY